MEPNNPDQEKIETYQALTKAIETGRSAGQFLQSDIGRFIIDRAWNCEYQAKQELVALRRSDFTSDSEYIAKATEIQWKARIPNMMLLWIDESIHEAEMAKNQSIEVERAEEYGDY